MEKCVVLARQPFIPVRCSLPTRSFKPGEFAHVADGAEQLRGVAHKISVEQLLPRIAERTTTALETLPAYMYFFSALRGGRRCSCFDVEAEPSNLCSACFGTGWVGGFTKYGTELIVLDVTHPNIRTTNIVPDYSVRTRPTRFTLIDGANHGSLEVRIHLSSNVGQVDALKAAYYTKEDNSLSAFIKGAGDPEPVALNVDNLQQRLGNPWLDVKVDFNRGSTNSPPPYLDNIYIRYLTMTDTLVKVDLPRTEKSVLLADIGLDDNWDLQNFFLDNTIKSITTEDFFVTETGRTRFKITAVKDFAPAGYLTSWDVGVRLVRNHEPYNKVPHVLAPPSKPSPEWEVRCHSNSGTCP